jgi:hypothetical protein
MWCVWQYPYYFFMNGQVHKQGVTASLLLCLERVRCVVVQ